MDQFSALAAALMIGAAAAAPVIRGIYLGTDTLFHLYRLVHLDHLVRQGILYSRWVPDLAYGFGYPLFNYYGPAAYYLAEVLCLAGMSPTQAFTASFVFAFLLASVSTYLWISDLFGQRAGIIAAAAYVFSPYMMMTALHRGALPEQMALGLLPLILYSFRRLVLSRNWTYTALATASYAILILVHNITALLFTPVLFGYTVLVAANRGNGGAARWDGFVARLSRPLLAMTASVALAAFYWLPAMWERDLVQIQQLFGPEVFDVRRNFLSLADLFVPRLSTDPNLVFVRLTFGLNLGAVILAMMAVPYLLRAGASSGSRLATLKFALVVFLAGLLMTLPITSFLWTKLPFLPFLQFPWRFLGPALLFAAALAGVGGDAFVARLASGSRGAELVTVALIAFNAVAVIPWQFAEFTAQPVATVSGSVQYELESGLVGTTATGEYTPVRVKELPPAGDFTWPDDFQGPVPSSLPEGGFVLAIEREPLRYRATVELPSPAALVYNTFFFEGWQAYVDGEPAVITPTDPYGLISLDVPAGRHQLLLQFESTPLRRLAGAISIVGLFMAGALVYTAARGKSNRTAAMVQPIPAGGRLLILLSISLALLVAIKQGYLDRTDNFFRQSRFDGRAVSGVDVSLAVSFEEQLILMGLDGPTNATSGSTVDFQLFWRVPRQLEDAYSSSVVLRDEQGFTSGQSDNQPISGVPTNLWKPSQYAEDVHELRIAPGTPPGKVTVQITVYRYGQPEKRLDVLDANGAPAGQTVTIAEINVTRPRRPATLEEIRAAGLPVMPVLATGDGIFLAGYEPPWPEARAGDRIPLVLYWQAGETVGGKPEARFELVDTAGQTVLRSSLPGVSDDPAFEWQAGDLWRANDWIRLPAGLPSGSHTMVVKYGEQSVTLGTLALAAPDHTYVAPSPAYGDNAIFGELSQLVGFDMPREAEAGQQVTVTLYWLALQESETSYKTFVQLLGSDQRLVVGSDQIPAGWSRPTTGWVEGEYIRDVHSLGLPPGLQPGEYTVVVGMYGEDSLQRLSRDGGGDTATLAQRLRVTAGD